MGLERLGDFLLDPGVPPALIYSVLFVGCVVESFFPPWPTDVITLYASFLAGRGQLAPGLVFGVAVAGTQAGVMAAFWLSRRFGPILLTGPLGRFLPVARLSRLDGWFTAYGAPAIAVSRFLPGIRALVTPAAGLASFPAWKVWIFAGGSVVLWNAFVVGVGLLAGTHLGWAKQILLRYNTAALALLGVLAAAWAGCRLYRRVVRG